MLALAAAAVEKPTTLKKAQAAAAPGMGAMT
jgi:hypothetical protein